MQKCRWLILLVLRKTQGAEEKITNAEKQRNDIIPWLHPLLQLVERLILLLNKSVSIYWGNIDGWLISLKELCFSGSVQDTDARGGTCSSLRLTRPQLQGPTALHNSLKFTPKICLNEHLKKEFFGEMPWAVDSVRHWNRTVRCVLFDLH